MCKLFGFCIMFFWSVWQRTVLLTHLQMFLGTFRCFVETSIVCAEGKTRQLTSLTHFHWHPTADDGLLKVCGPFVMSRAKCLG